jgi:hypothetical protein
VPGVASNLECMSGSDLFYVEECEVTEQKQFMFRVTVKDPNAAIEKVAKFFNENSIKFTDSVFDGAGYQGRWAIADHDVIITVTKKPLWVFNYMIIEKVKKFLNDD